MSGNITNQNDARPDVTAEQFEAPQGAAQKS